MPMIGDVRKLKRVAVHKPEDRAQRNDESSHGCKRSFSDSPAQRPKKRQPPKHCCREQKEPGVFESPPRIDEGKVRGQDKFRKIETDDAPGQDHSLHLAQGPVRPGCPDVMRFQPRGQQRKRNAEKEIGNKRDEVGGSQSWPLPPDEDG